MAVLRTAETSPFYLSPQETAQIIVDELDAVEKELLQHPDRPLDEDFKRLRQAAYKKTHGQRRDPDDAFVDETEY